LNTIAFSVRPPGEVFARPTRNWWYPPIAAVAGSFFREK
jgi:hypothetical protein